MIRALTILTLLLTVAATALADNRTMTFFSDGALVELETTAIKGFAEILLPEGMLANSLRIKPLGDSAIQRVEILSVRQEGNREKELDTLLERKNRLEDRLQALATREEIFKSAAKSQSGKAPRKTKTNPDPMQTIRQGTDFAIAQLEAVNTARRKAMQEIRHIDARIAEARKGGAGSQNVARVAVAPRNGRVRVRYALAGPGWTPRYDIRLWGDNSADLILFGQLPGAFAGYQLRAAPATLADSFGTHPLALGAGSSARLAEYRLPLDEVHFGNDVQNSFSFLLTNRTAVHLPAGEASLYRNGEYLGRLVFAGISSGRSRRISSAR